MEDMGTETSSQDPLRVGALRHAHVSRSPAVTARRSGPRLADRRKDMSRAHLGYQDECDKALRPERAAASRNDNRSSAKAASDQD